MKKIVIVCGVALLALAGCGGSDDESSTEPADDVTATTETDDDTEDVADDETDDESGSEATSPPESDDDSGGSDDAGGSGPSTATVTIGGETYEFSTEDAIVAQCQTDMFGIFSVQLPGVDGGIGIVALREGTDPEVVGEVNSVEVSIGDEDWVADEDSDLFDMSEALQPGMSQVDSVEVDGSTVRGTATFVRELSLFVEGEPEIVTGTFEATCGEERIT